MSEDEKEAYTHSAYTCSADHHIVFFLSLCPQAGGDGDAAWKMDYSALNPHTYSEVADFSEIHATFHAEQPVLGHQSRPDVSSTQMCLYF